MPLEQEAASNTIEAVRFSFYTSQEAKALSVKEIVHPESFDNNNQLLPSGVHDPALGFLKGLSDQRCITCGKYDFCNGHFGHINLVMPVYNPFLVDTLHAVLQRTCFSCFHFKESKSRVGLFISQLKLIAKGDFAGAKSLDPELSTDSLSREGSNACDVSSSTEIFDCSADSFLPSKRLKWSSLQFNEAMSVLHNVLGSKDTNQSCSNCKAENPTITIDTFGWFHKQQWKTNSAFANNLEELNALGPTESDDQMLQDMKADLMHVSNQELSSLVLRPLEVKEIMERLWENESVFFSYMNDIQHHGYVEHAGASMFFLETILVPPNKFRPFFVNNDDDSVLDSGITSQLRNVLKDNKSLTAQDAFFEERTMISRWIALQNSVNNLFGDRNQKGIRKLLERKQGILHSNMMGKNTNYLCRSVICPDPYLAVNEIGIPEHFALTLTYPERVTPWNVTILRDAIFNGAEIYPGATHYFVDSFVFKMDQSLSKRLSIARKLCTARGVTRAGNISNEHDSQIVYRHLRDGDVVLVNGQPALHKSSIMAHVVRVTRGEKTIRMHYANCSAYGVGFDGDEINVHVPQDDISRAEAFGILNANEQYVRSIDGLPLKGLIQDHIVSAALLTKKDTFLRYHEFTQLCYSSIASTTRTNFYSKHDKKVAVIDEDNWMCPWPASLKPEPLWTGKQVISVVLQRLTKGFLPFTMERRGKLPSDFFKRKISGNTEKSMQRKDTEVKRDNYHRRRVFYKQLKDHCDTRVVSNHEKFKRSQEPGEDTVVIFSNYLVSGVIDKAQFGSYGLVHTFQELYGSDSAGSLLLALGRLFTAFLQMHGFTCGVDDLLLEKDADKRRKKQLDECARSGLEVNCELVGVTDTENLDPVELQMKIEEFIHSNGESALTNLDMRMISKLNELSNNIQKDLLFRGLLKPAAKNCMSLMTTSGAQGGIMNFQEISSHLHQQEFEGKRVPRMSSGKTLPSFPPWDWEARAGGFIADRYLTGLRPQEYYFHCMSGREGLVDTAINTSINAYLLRCLIKNLESLQVSYDRTVRDADGSIIQFYYGEDGVDVEKASFLTNFDVLSANHELMKVKLSSYDGDGDGDSYIKDVPLILRNKMMEWTSGKSLKIYKSVEDFMKLVKHKYFSSLAQPGEAVGILAAQSIGKPATQLMNDAAFYADKLNKITLAETIHSLEVRQVPFAVSNDQVYSIYKLKMKLKMPQFCSMESWKEVLEVKYLKMLEEAIKDHLKILSNVVGIEMLSRDSSVEDGLQGNNSEHPVNNREVDDCADDDDMQEDRKEEMDFAWRCYSFDEDEMYKAEERYSSKDDASKGLNVRSGMTIGIKLSERTLKEDEEKKKFERVRKPVDDSYRSVFCSTHGSNFEIHFKFTDRHHILLGQIALEVANKICVTSCVNVFPGQLQGSIPALQTNGVDFDLLWSMDDILDISHIFSNDILAVQKWYGIEAARESIMKELQHVLRSNGVLVDFRHLSLIADFMTHTGKYMALNRHGLIAQSISPLSKMTFAASTEFVAQAALHGDIDYLRTPSASTCLGQIVKMGTGVIDIFQKIE